MSFWADRRGQSMQIGAMLLFGMLVVSMATYQVTVVPNQNGDVEFKHNQQVRDQLQEGRDALLRTGATGSGQPAVVDLGTQFPSRTVFINPPAPSGTLETTDLGTLTVSGAVGTGEVGDFWDGSDRTYPTRGFVYTPDYSEYQHPPTTVYEHSVLYDRVGDGTEVAKTGQDLVDGRRLNFVTLDGRLSTGRSGAMTLDFKPVSASTKAVSLTDTDDGGPVSVTFRTGLSEETWRELLEDEFDFADGAVTLEDADFESGTLPGGWSNEMSHGSAGVTNTDANSGTYSMYLSGEGSVHTNTHDTSSSGSVTVDYWWKMDEDSPPESDQNEDLFVEYLASNGTWVELARYDSATVDPGTTGQATHTISDSEASHGGFEIRFRQEDASSDDYWFVDDVEVVAGGNEDTTNDRYISGFSYDDSTSPNTVSLRFERGVSYDLRLSKVGVGSAVTDTRAAYVVPVSGDGMSVATGSTQRLTVEVRDEYNNPVSGVTISMTPADRFDDAARPTDADGRATFTYNASQTPGTETVTASFDGGETSTETATFDVTVESETSAVAKWDSADDWDASSTESGVVHESNPNVDGATSESIKLGHPMSDGGLLHYYPLDEDSGETATDLAGANDGTRHGGALDGIGLAGTTSYDFDGSNDYVDLGTPDVPGTGITISAWVNAESWSSGNDPRIVSKADGPNNGDHWWMLSEYEGKLRFRLKNEHNGGSEMVTDSLQGGSLPTGTWTHVVATYNGSYMAVHVDGKEVAATPETGAIATDGSVPAYIGGNPGSELRPFDGNIDEVRIYDRGLSESEVDDLYAAGTTGSLATGWTDTSLVNVDRLELRNVQATLPAGTSITLHVVSDTDGDGTYDEYSDAVELDGSGGPYDVTGLTTNTDRFALHVELSTTDPSVSPTFSGVELTED